MFFYPSLLLNDWWHYSYRSSNIPKRNGYTSGTFITSSLPASTSVTVESLRSAVQNIVGQDMNLPEEFDNAAGEMYVP